MIPADVRRVMEEVLTPKQLEAFELEQYGYGLAAIGRKLSITKGAAVSRVDGAHLKLRKAGIRMDEFGRWIVEAAA